jgi:DUF4097 and DUF4098 domain-containing protein YvlB
MHPHRFGIILVALLGLSLFAACDGNRISGVGNTNFSAEEPFSIDIARQNRTMFSLEGISGSVRVTGSPGASSISVTGVRRVESSSVEDATAHLAQLEVEVDSSQAEVVVRTIQPSNSAGRNYIVNYVISLPEDLVVDIANVNGDITVASLKSNAEIHCVNGPILADGIEGNITTEVANGGIGASVTLPPAGHADMRVTNGNIVLRIPQATSAKFSATAVNGSITLKDLTLSDATQTPGSLKGTLGDGDGTISLVVVNGIIVVRGI